MLWSTSDDKSTPVARPVRKAEGSQSEIAWPPLKVHRRREAGKPWRSRRSYENPTYSVARGACSCRMCRTDRPRLKSRSELRERGSADCRRDWIAVEQHVHVRRRYIHLG